MTILFYGDSITHGGRGLSMDGNHILGHGYQSILASKIGYERMEERIQFINKGVSGDTVSMLYSRLTKDVLVHKPDVVSILVGINDVIGNQGMPMERITRKYIDTYRMLLEDLRAVLPKTKILICEPFYLELDNFECPLEESPYFFCEEEVSYFHIPQNREQMEYIREQITSFQRELVLLAQEQECNYVPLQEAFLKATQQVPAQYLVWDSIHPTIVGHELIARRWLEEFKKMEYH